MENESSSNMKSFMIYTFCFFWNVFIWSTFIFLITRFNFSGWSLIIPILLSVFPDKAKQ